MKYWVKRFIKWITSIAELSDKAKKIITLIQWIAIIVGVCSHSATCKKLDETNMVMVAKQKQIDTLIPVLRKTIKERDSCKIQIIENK